MPTAKKVAANRANALKSTGPRTPDGKARSARNAWKHGLTAQHVVLSVEDRVEFEELRARLVAEHQPVGTQELLLVSQIADAWWRGQRARKLETAAFERGFQDSANSDMAILAVFEREAATLERLRRYINQFDRNFHRSLDQLCKLQADRRRTTPPPPQPVAARDEKWPAEPPRPREPALPHLVPEQPRPKRADL